MMPLATKVCWRENHRIRPYSGRTRGTYLFSSNPEVGQKLAFGTSCPATLPLSLRKCMRNDADSHKGVLELTSSDTSILRSHKRPLAV